MPPWAHVFIPVQLQVPAAAAGARCSFPVLAKRAAEAAAALRLPSEEGLRERVARQEG